MHAVLSARRWAARCAPTRPLPATLLPCLYWEYVLRRASISARQGNAGATGLPYAASEEVHTAYKARSSCGWSLFNATNNKDKYVYTPANEALWVFDRWR